MRSEDETYDETATFENGGDHAAMPQNLESEHRRDHSPMPNPSGGRRRSMRRSFLGQLGLVEAQKVDDAEPVFYASVVTNRYFKRKKVIVFGTGFLLLVVALALALGLTMRNRGSACAADDLCCVDFEQLPMAPESVLLLCHCNQSLEPYTSSLTDANITFANLLRDSLIFLDAFPNSTVQAIPADDPADQCSVYNQLYWAGARMDVVNVDELILQNAPPSAILNAYALLYLYTAMSGLTWNERENWFETAFTCTYYGVDCIFIDTVAGLKLSGNDLKVR